MKLKNSELKEIILYLSIILLVTAVFSFLLFGITGARVVFSIIFVSIPFYFILNNFELAEGEKFVFSILLGLAIFPSLVYIFGFLISFRISIIIIFIVLIGIAILLHKYKNFKK